MVAVAIIIERLWMLRRSNYLQTATVQTLSGLLASDKFHGAVDYCRRHPGPFTDLVTTLVENRYAPYDELKEILEDTGRLQLMGLQRGLPALATIVAGAPLLGLLGTVIGMIKIFTVVATGGFRDHRAALVRYLAGAHHDRDRSRDRHSGALHPLLSRSLARSRFCPTSRPRSSTFSTWCASTSEDARTRSD